MAPKRPDNVLFWVRVGNDWDCVHSVAYGRLRYFVPRAVEYQAEGGETDASIKYNNEQFEFCVPST